VLAAGCAVLAVGLLDQTAPPAWTANGSEIKDWRNDAAYVAAIEDRVPAGTAIFELPTLPFPESTPVRDVHDYDPIRPYLHSTDLSWSYGAVKGRPRTDWPQVVEELPIVRIVVALTASGFGGLHLDTYAYPDHDPGKTARVLTELLGPPITSPDKRFQFYDMTGFATELGEDYSASELATLKRHTIGQPIFYWQPGFAGPPSGDGAGHRVLVGRSAAPSAWVNNPGGPIRMKLTFTIQAVQAQEYPATVDISWPDGQSESVRVGTEGKVVSHTFTARHGVSTLRVQGATMTSINLIDLALRDPVLYDELRGRAAEVATRFQDDEPDQSGKPGRSDQPAGSGTVKGQGSTSGRSGSTG
jgi:phosphoglycerol transferase